MKKLISLIICILMMFTVAYGASYPDIDSNDAAAEAVFDVSSLGIMEGFEDGTFRPEEKLTRAQFAKIAVTTMGVRDASPVATDFSDVTADHWASGYIKFASDAKLINGVGDGLFAPESEVVLQDAIKIVVGILGRTAEAEAKGGYPSGYLAVAFGCDLTKNISATATDAITRGEAAQLISNALDANIMESDYSSSGNWYVSKDTLRDVLSRRADSERIEGVVTANTYTSMTSSDVSYDDRIEIDGVLYKTKADYNDFFGYNVIAYVSDGRNKEIISIQKFSNNETIVNAEDVFDISSGLFKWYREDNKEDKLNIDNASVIYNGKFKSKLPLIQNGTYTLLDNNDDGKIDVVFVDEYENFIVKRVSGDAIYFDNDVKFRGKSAFKIDSNDYDAVYSIYDFEDKALNVSDIQPGMSIMISASEDGNLVNVYAQEKYVEGTVTALSSDSSFIEIDGASYSIAKDASGKVPFAAKLGDNGKYALNKYGYVINVLGDVFENEQFGYVANAVKSKGIANTLSLKVVKSGSREKITEIVADTEIITYEFANSDIITLEFASKVNVDGYNVSSDSIHPLDFVGKVISYSLNSEGKIRKITSYEVTDDTTTYAFNAKLQSFGGYSSREAFIADEYTNIICVPETADSDDDWFEVVSLAHKGTYDVKPIAIDPDTQKAKAAVIIAKMDADSPTPVDSDQKVSIVWGVSGSIVDGEEAYKVTMLTGEEIEEIYTKSSGDTYDTVLSLKKGDLIKYSLDAFDRLSTVNRLASIQGLDKFYRANENSPSETAYALCYSIEVNKLSQLRNEMVDEISICFAEDGSGRIVEYDLPREDGPSVYKYNRRTGDISIASTDEIASFEEVGSDATEVFVVVRNNSVQTLVIIEN